MHTGPAEIAPGFTIIPTGGHTPGFQFCRIHTRRGWVALASDASHFYENLESNRPFPAATNIPDILEGFDKVRAAADSPQHFVPGHDPEVMKRYPSVSKELEGIAVRLDVMPNK
jgi:glyoxylase-like metal-dependent hydrolase (beta-lactamase superfamily II)